MGVNRSDRQRSSLWDDPRPFTVLNGYPPPHADRTVGAVRDRRLCTTNALGGAIVGSFAQDAISDALTDGVRDGSISIALKTLGLDDLSGVSDPSLELGILTGSPVNPASPDYNGTNDLDWWYTTAASVIDAMRNPTTTLSASLMMRQLNAGPSDISITINLAGAPATLNMLRAKLFGETSNPTKPLTSTGMPPGHLASEHLDAGLTSFPTVTKGELCGAVTAGSLHSVAAPDALSMCGYDPATNTLLDAIVGGCTVIIFTQIRATQPDTARMPGDTYTFTVGSGRRINGCRKNGQTAMLNECLANAAYSVLFRFTTDRVIMK